jgi:hypothetical protein
MYCCCFAHKQIFLRKMILDFDINEAAPRKGLRSTGANESIDEAQNSLLAEV